ncbi:MAG: thioredoxin family protein, partial [Saprospiraceae bacterium]
EYQIMSIPNVKMFYQGKVIGEFMGAYPRPAIERWLNEFLPDERKDSLANILSHINGKADEVTLQKLEQFIHANPDVKEAKLAFAKQIVFGQPDWALELVENIHLGDPLYEEAEDVRTLAQWMQMEVNDSDAPAAKALDQARTAARNQQSEIAIRQIIEATTLDKHLQNDLPRRVAIALFRRWGHQHPLTQNYRWRFDMALY